MEITGMNFMTLLTYAVDELTLINARLKEIDMDVPDTHEEIQILNGRFVEAVEPVSAIIEYIVHEKADPAVVGDKLKRVINIMSEIFREKTRIIKATPRIIYETNDETSLN